MKKKFLYKQTLASFRFINISNRQLFDKIEKTIKNNSDNTKHDFTINKSIFVFDNIPIIYSKKYNKHVLPFCLYGILYPSIVFTGYKAIIKILSFKIFGSILFSLLCLGTLILTLVI